jgi:hypothetical protein
MLTRRDILGTLVTAALASATPASAAAKQSSTQTAPAPPGFGLAVVRMDGLLVPIGWFNGTAWDATWPEPGRHVEVPATLASIPNGWMPGRIPERWHLWMLDDPMVRASPFEPTQARSVNVLGPVRYHAHCVIAVGLKTDFTAGSESSIEDTAHPKPKAGLALTQPDTRVESIVTVDPGSELGKWVAARAVIRFNRAEDALRETEDLANPSRLPDGPDRKKTPIKWTKILRRGTAQGAVKTYYVEGEKDYGATVTTGHVWLQFDRERETADSEVELSDIDRKGSTFRHPLGVIRAAARQYWIFQATGYESEDYEIFELLGPERPPRLVLRASGGGC